MDNPFVELAELQFLRGSSAEALRIARMGLSLFPDDVALLELAATCAGSEGDDEYAVACWRRLLERDPSLVTAHNSLGLALHRRGLGGEAETAYRRAFAAFPDDPALAANLALLLEDLGRFDEAENHQRRALALAPDSAEIRSNLAGLLLKAGQEAEAEKLYREAIRLKPAFAKAHSNLAILLVDQGRAAEAEACFRAALALQPDAQQARMNFAQLLLLQGRFAEGWPLYEARQHVRAGAGSGALSRPPSCRQWQGEGLADKSIVVIAEQGLGDEIQFVRYLAWLKAQGPRHLTLLCRPCLQVLLKTLAGPDLVVSLNDAEPYLDSHDYWVFLLSLPLHAGTVLSTIPSATPYLFADPLRVARHAALLAGDGLRVGLVWRGNPQNANDADRSLAGLEVLAPLWRLAGVRFFSVQHGATGAAPLPPELPLTALGPAIEDMADTAAMLSQLDLLIAVDTAVAHLAGALGLPCWLLLPAYKTDWRWLQQRRDSPWYPSMRLFRQAQRGDWTATVAELAEALRDFRDGV
jgi:Flp pilus assembly protein TadD